LDHISVYGLASSAYGETRIMAFYENTVKAASIKTLE
jgi:hypothetical protein